MHGAMHLLHCWEGRSGLCCMERLLVNLSSRLLLPRAAASESLTHCQQRMAIEKHCCHSFSVALPASQPAQD